MEDILKRVKATEMIHEKDDGSSKQGLTVRIGTLSKGKSEDVVLIGITSLLTKKQ